MLEPLKRLDDVVKKPFKPDPSYEFYGEEYRAFREGLAPWIGIIAIAIPVVILIANFLGLATSRNSISHYYYAAALGDWFITALIFVGTFLIAYKGESRTESYLATGAGICCFFIALFPTAYSGLESGEVVSRDRIFVDVTNIPTDRKMSMATKDMFEASSYNLYEGASTVHIAFAAVFFVILAIFCFAIFTRIKDNQKKADDKLKTNKFTRNGFYYSCGLIITGCIIAMGYNMLFGEGDYWDKGNWTFFFEGLALATFGFAWLVKGKFWGFALEDE